MSEKRKLSIIIPCYNSSKMIRHVIEESIKYLDELDSFSYEFVLVNDCSADGTFDVIRELVSEYSFIKGIDLAHNAGQHNALLAGLRIASGDLYMGMDDDMQTHPSQIQFLINKLDEGYDIVYGTYDNKKASLFRKLGSNFNSYTVAKMIGKPKEMKISSFWVIRSFVRDVVIQYNSSFTNLQGNFLKASKRITNVHIEHFQREEGSSGYTLKKLLKLWASVLNYSMLPLRAAMACGVLLAIIACIHVIIALVFSSRINVSTHVIIILMEFFSALIIFFIGVVGEYLGRMFMVLTNQKQSIIREIIGNNYTANNNNE